MTFLTDMMKKGHLEEEILAVLVESEKDRKRKRMLAIVTETFNAHRLQKMRDLLTFEKLATWRRMNGFDRIADGEENWFHGPRSLPLTPEEYTPDLWCKVNELKDAISMSRQKASNLINGIEQGKVSNKEFAILRRLVEKRDREEAQMTATPVDTVHHCSPCPLNPEMPPDICMGLESNEGKMNPELKELEPPSAGAGPETPGQQCPPNEGTWDQGRTIANGYSLVGMGSNQGGDISSPTTERVNTQAARTTEYIKFLQQGHKPRDEKKGSEENRKFDPGEKGEKAPLWNAAVTLSSFFSAGSVGPWEARCLCFIFFFFVCVLLLCSIMIVPSR